MTTASDSIVPVEVITITAQRSVHYVEADSPKIAMDAIKRHIAVRPELYDDQDEVISLTHIVQHPDNVIVPNDAYVETLDDLARDEM